MGLLPVATIGCRGAGAEGVPHFAVGPQQEPDHGRGEQARLSELRIGVAGLSVGHAIAHALALQGQGGELRLADFDQLELSNLNRVPATVLDLGINKAIVAARRIAELDPYIGVEVFTDGVTSRTLDDFVEGLDVVVEECDSLDIKVMVREAARQRGIPVVMSTSDRGLVDVERFDLEPDRPILHGLLGEVPSAQLAGLAVSDKIPAHMLRHLDANHLSPRLAASFVEVGHTLSTWPQLSGDIALGAAVMAEAWRQIAIGEPLALRPDTRRYRRDPRRAEGADRAPSRWIEDHLAASRRARRPDAARRDSLGRG